MILTLAALLMACGPQKAQVLSDCHRMAQQEYPTNLDADIRRAVYHCMQARGYKFSQTDACRQSAALMSYDGGCYRHAD